jgi:hypothetical protein
VDDPDGLQADNVRYAVLNGAKPPSVLLVTGSGDAGRDAFYVQQALAAGGPAGSGYDVSSLGAAALSSTASDSLSQHPAVLLLSTRGLDRRRSARVVRAKRRRPVYRGRARRRR